MAWPTGYRKPLSGPGSWVARLGNSDGKGWEKTLWTADDHGLKADGEKVLSFWQAKAEVQKLAGKRPGAEQHAAPEQGDATLTLDEALTLYKSTLSERGADSYNADRPRCHVGDTLLSKPCALITEGELKALRAKMLEGGSAPASVNRTMTPLRAALTIAAPSLTHRWRLALKALSSAVEADNVVISDPAKVRQFVHEAYRRDEQFGLYVHTLTESGARPSQAARLLVRDLINDAEAPRLMMPRSGKGRHHNPQQRKIERYAVSISLELATKLQAAAKDRPSNAPLLLQADGRVWGSKNEPGRDAAQFYGPAVAEIMKTIGLDPDVYTVYCLRHTRITNMLLQGVHTAIVAKCHDTSEEMVRRHYSAAILDHTDQITRKTLPRTKQGRKKMACTTP